MSMTRSTTTAENRKAFYRAQSPLGKPLELAEAEALRLAALGRTYIEIAHVQRRSEGAVKEALYRCRRKLGVERTIDAFRAIGWLRVPDATEAAAVRSDATDDGVSGRDEPYRASVAS